MLPTSEIQILNAFKGNLLAGKTIRAIALAIKKPYPHVHKHVHELLNKNILKKREVGPSYECYLNLRAEQCRLAMSLSTYDSSSRNSRLAEALAKILPNGTIVFLEKENLHIVADNLNYVKAQMKKLPKLSGLSKLQKGAASSAGATGTAKVSPTKSFPKRRIFYHTPKHFFTSEINFSMPVLLIGQYDFFTKFSEMTASVVMNR